MSSSPNEASIINALQALKQDPTLTIRRAARIYNVPRTTLTRRRQETRCQADSIPKS